VVFHQAVPVRQSVCGMRNMYFGSVRFFKHLILFLIALMILLPSAGFLSVTIQNNRLVKEMKYLSEQNQLLLNEVAELSDFEPDLAVDTEPQIPTEPDTPEEASFSYQELYPDLYCTPATEQSWPEKTAFLTFDDGPSQYTDEILAILDKHNVKATFFVVGKNTEEGRARMRRIVEAGHEIAIHTYSHMYSQIYASVEDYLDDFFKIYKLIQDATGVTPTIFRFPGGSINGYNRAIYQQIIAEMTRRGFTYYDWNISASDTADHATAKSIQASILNAMGRYNCSVILMHDGNRETLRALDSVITGIEETGYSFGLLTNEIRPVMFSYRD
jgi:peptidoglycan/xylan/chitin deacetylase (PgdA/CDA1 family)